MRIDAPPIGLIELLNEADEIGAVEASIEEDVPAYVLATSLFTRFRSRQHPAFADKVLSAMRKGFGDHKEVPTEQIRAGVEASIQSWKKAFGK